MVSERLQMWDFAGAGAATPPTDVRATDWRRAALVETERLRRDAVAEGHGGAAGELTITSVQRGGRYTAIAVGGEINPWALAQLRCYLTGLFQAGVRRLMVDVSGVSHGQSQLVELIRRAQEHLVALYGSLELTGLTPPALRALDDSMLAEVFVAYRALAAEAGSFAATRFPEGLEEVSEPHTAGRHRAVFDIWARP